jgi:hypothetical protein
MQALSMGIRSIDARKVQLSGFRRDVNKVPMDRDPVEKKNAQEGAVYRSLHAIREQFNAKRKQVSVFFTDIPAVRCSGLKSGR